MSTIPNTIVVKFVVTYQDGRKENVFRRLRNSSDVMLKVQKNLRLSLPSIKRVDFFSEPVSA
jgi:hypothetical protein